MEKPQKAQNIDSLHENAPNNNASLHVQEDVPVSVDTQEIVTFVDDVPETLPEVKDRSQDVEVANPMVDQSLMDILKRPRLISTLSWKPSDAFGKLLARIVFPDCLFKYPLLWKKLSNYSYLRSSVKISARVNGTAYHFGQLMLAFRPCAIGRTYEPSSSRYSFLDSLVQSSQLSHILLDPSSNQVSSFTIPFQCPLKYMILSSFSQALNVDRSLSNLGILDVYVMTPLKTRGKTDDPPVTVSLMASFEDPIELHGYTHQSFNFAESNPATLPTAVVPTALRFTDTPTATVQGFAYDPLHLSDTKGSDVSQHLDIHPLSASPSPASPVPLNTHLSTWSFLFRKEIDMTAAPNSLVLAIPVTPHQCATGTADSKTFLLHTKLSYLSYFFNAWSGPIEYRFDFVASKFHSARFKIAWYPPATNSLAPGDSLSDDLTQVFDVQSTCSTTFTVPFLNPQSIIYSSSPSSSQRNGLLVVTVLNTPTFPEPSGPKITMNVWIRAPKLTLYGLTTSLTPPQIPVGVAPLGTDQPQYITQSGPASFTEHSSINALIHKHTPFISLKSASKLWMTPPKAEVMPKATIATNQVQSLGSYLDAIGVMHLGYTGSISLQVLNPSSDVLVVPRYSRGITYQKDEKRTTAMSSDLAKSRFTSLAYFPPSINAAKSFTLPCYTTMIYRPFTYASNLDSTTFVIPGIDVYKYDASETLFSIAAASDFTFYGVLPAPMVLAESATRSLH